MRGDELAAIIISAYELINTDDPEEIIKAIHSVHESGYYFNELVKTRQ